MNDDASVGCADWLRPELALGRVGALMTTRRGGVSQAAWATMNLGSACDDDPVHVEANRAILARNIGHEPSYLRQVHGREVIELGRSAAPATTPPSPQADACFTTQPGVVCTVLAADCLPLLFAVPDGRGVAAAHAGWRGLAAGVVEVTLERLCVAARCQPRDVHVWLGACIGPAQFQVGRDVLEAFGAGADSPGERFRPDPTGRWLADLPGLARDRLARTGVVRVDGGSWCTVSDPARFFSYRRDGVTGRMAACVWIR